MQEATVAKPIDYVPGLDELADEIGARPGEDTFGITLRGKSGRQYVLPAELFAGKLARMAADEERV